jgi:hypothetical protein
MKLQQVSLAQNVVMIAGLLASIALGLNSPHIRPGAHLHQSFQVVSTISSIYIHDCAASDLGMRRAQIRERLYFCKHCSGAYSVSHVICPSLFEQEFETTRADFMQYWPTLFPASLRSFHHPP